mmetsp:Transcript_34890/g.108528  ORF Transcript_34890/g.108528 Transcript_34890/m.108528 type:complete len:250 (+) Transcript_34890:1107-1856(+)
MTNVTGGRTDEPRDSMLLHVLRHVEADHLGVTVKELCGQGLRQLRLADPRWPGEEERAHRPAAALQAGRADEHRPGHGIGCLVLAEHPRLESGAQPQEPFTLALRQPLHGDARPTCHHLRNVVNRDGLPEHGQPLGLFTLQSVDALLEPRDGLVPKVGDCVQVAADLRQLHLALQHFELLLRLLQLGEQLLLPLVLRPHRFELLHGPAQLLLCLLEVVNGGLVRLLCQSFDLDLKLHPLPLKLIQLLWL